MIPAFDLIRPCANCPFRTDHPVYLKAGTARLMVRTVLTGGVFPCHETMIYDAQWADDGEPQFGVNTQFCAGALIFATLAGRGEALRFFKGFGFDPARLDLQAPVCKSRRELMATHKRLMGGGK